VICLHSEVCNHGFVYICSKFPEPWTVLRYALTTTRILAQICPISFHTILHSFLILSFHSSNTSHPSPKDPKAHVTHPAQHQRRAKDTRTIISTTVFNMATKYTQKSLYPIPIHNLHPTPPQRTPVRQHNILPRPRPCGIGALRQELLDRFTREMEDEKSEEGSNLLQEEMEMLFQTCLVFFYALREFYLGLLHKTTGPANPMCSQCP
jgi:hypothetical protein